MRTATEGPIILNWFSSGVADAGMQLSVAVKGTFSLVDKAIAKPADPIQEAQGDVFCDDDQSRSLYYPSDFVPFKPKADILLVGVAHAPEGRAVTQLDVGFRVGGFKKALCIRGDRFWHRHFLLWSEASDPAAFKSMPMVYERAFGGPKFKANPIGVGLRGKQLPNIESRAQLIRGRRNRPPPAGFGPISTNWYPRRSKTGTYKGKWLKERWPWFPEDFDWRYFNAAPEDQQVEGYLRGDEDLEFQNLHPQHAIYQSRLPSLRARAFVQIELPGLEPEFREVKLNLDTLWIDMESEKLVLVWRGLTPVRSVKFKEVTHLAALTEPLDSPTRPKEEMREWMLQRIREEQGKGPPTPEEAAEEAEKKAIWASLDKDMAAMDKEKAEMEKEFEATEQEMADQFAQEKSRLIAEGVDPRIFEPPLDAQSFAEMKAQLADEVAKLSETDPQAAAKLASVGEDLDELAATEKEFADFEAKGSPPPSPEAAQAAVAEGRPLIGADLSGLDFSNRDLSGGDFSDADFSNANLSNAKLSKCKLAGANFSEANLTGADLSQAVLDRADFSNAKLQKAKFSGTSIEGALFGEQQLQGVDFSDCRGRHPDFASSNLEGANFARAKLPHADFCGANVKAANFVEAELISADFGGVAAMGINMQKADLTNLRAAEKSNFTGGNFRAAKAPRSIWEGSILDRADFSRTVLTDALFEDASLKEANFDRANLIKANFEDASAERALLTNANLLRASFNGANLTETKLDGSNLYEASFWETVFGKTTAEGANLKRTALA